MCGLAARWAENKKEKEREMMLRLFDSNREYLP